MKVGYARVSSHDQNLAVQLDKLQAAGCEKVYQEKVSGRTIARPKLQECLEFVRDHHDVLLITKLDRLARSLADLIAIMTRLQAKEVSLVVLDQAIDTGTPTGKLLFNLLGAIAEFENDLRRERQREGIDAALRRGQHFGRKHRLTSAHVVEMQRRRKEGVLIKTLMQDYHLSKASTYRYLKQGTALDNAAAD